MAATGESRTVVLGELLNGLTVSDVLADDRPVDASDSAATVFDRLLASRRSELAVAENGRVVGVVTGSLLREIPPEAHQTTTAGSLATTDLPRVEVDTPAFDVLTRLRSERANVALVERDGALVGVVSRDDFAAVLDLRRETTAF